MVYGNAIKNGATNKDAYVSSVSGESILVNFLDHKGNGINTNNESKDPWISQKYAIKSADLVWEDSQDLIKAVSISGTENVKEEKFVKFYLDKENFTQGNAIIAVFESDGSLAWSWHIWATDADLTPVPVKSQLNTYNFLPVFLGWCEPKSEKSKNGGKYGNCTFYQWGRKDPMLGGTGSGASDKQYYCSDNPINLRWMKNNLQTNISQFIQHPNVFNTNEHMDQKYSNLWSIDAAFAPANFNPTKKTVYDPSPAGFCVPPSAAFTGFTSDGKMGTSLDKINSTEGCKSGEGIYFYTGGWKTGKLIPFPGIGSRNYLGTLSELNVGSCWTATCAENSLLLYYGASSPEYTVVTPYIYSAKANGNAVIPCQE